MALRCERARKWAVFVCGGPVLEDVSEQVEHKSHGETMIITRLDRKERTNVWV